jgi:oxygen-independent coproporphyrinogen-3 oxidase
MHYSPTAQTQSLYIHWPFCPYKCHFCPFVALASHDQFMERYHAALIAEIMTYASVREHNTSIKTIHFGGGTPSTYPPHLLLDMMSILKKSFVIVPDVEIAFEVNPGTVTAEKLNIWRDIGINRLSIGVQGVKDAVLQLLNRHQTAAQVYELLEAASPLFANISVDLIVGLPGVSAEEWHDLVEEVVRWPIVHISIYFLTVHEKTPLYFKVQANQIALPADEEVVASYEWSCGMLTRHGFEQYELSNFARPGYASRHNMAYWNRDPYKGFGIGACSFDGIVRMQNEKNIMRYMELCEDAKDCTIFMEELTEDQKWLELVMLGLRRPQGVALADLVNDVKRLSRVKKLSQEGFLEIVNDRVRLTLKGLAVENEILVQLVQE